MSQAYFFSDETALIYLLMKAEQNYNTLLTPGSSLIR